MSRNFHERNPGRFPASPNEDESQLYILACGSILEALGDLLDSCRYPARNY
jgi:hypothetical protein